MSNTQILKTIKFGSTGTLVSLWQTFLRGEELYFDIINGIFDDNTLKATKEYQTKYNHLLYAGVADGIVGPRTWGQSMVDGLNPFIDDLVSEEWPPKPTNLQPLTTAQKNDLFGEIKFVPAPVPGNQEAIKITNNWNATHLASITVPQLKNIAGAPQNCKIFFHKKGADQLLAMFDEFEKLHLNKLILSWSGSWAPRFIRGSRTVLSNHAFATAFDINYTWNKLGKRPALIGEKGSVRELVPIANKYGFYWGGHFSGRPDGMHFELTKLL